MDTFIGFWGSKSIGKEVSILIIAVFSVFLLFRLNYQINIFKYPEKGPENEFFFWDLLISFMGHHNAPEKTYGVYTGGRVHPNPSWPPV